MKVTGFPKLKRWLALFLPVTTTVRERLRDYIIALSLFPRGPGFVFGDQARQPATGILTDTVVPHEGRLVRFTSSDYVRFDQSYRDWISPLGNLPANASGEEFRLAVAQLREFRAEGQNLFPLETYLDSLPGPAGSVEWIQQCRCSRQEAINWAQALINQPTDSTQVAAPATLFIYGLKP